MECAHASVATDDPPTRTPPAAADRSQSALKGAAREYTAPDHSFGETFPGKQPPTIQLSLFDAGVTNCVAGFPKRRVTNRCDKT